MSDQHLATEIAPFEVAKNWPWSTQRIGRYIMSIHTYEEILLNTWRWRNTSCLRSQNDSISLLSSIRSINARSSVRRNKFGESTSVSCPLKRLKLEWETLNNIKVSTKYEQKEEFLKHLITKWSWLNPVQRCVLSSNVQRSVMCSGVFYKVTHKCWQVQAYTIKLQSSLFMKMKDMRSSYTQIASH